MKPAFSCQIQTFRFYFDATVRQCVDFSYKGLKGNAVGFLVIIFNDKPRVLFNPIVPDSGRPVVHLQ